MKDSPDWELNFDSAPFCNGSLHLGHVRTYALGDVRARWLRTRGVRVRYTTTFDSFGIPNEIGAERADLPADEFVDQQIERIRTQLAALNLSYDGAPPERYCDPSYYRWTQWLFLQLYERGLVYAVEQPTPFCGVCDSFLAHSQIEDGCCWRCDGHVESRQSMQWYVRSSDYSERLYEGIDSLVNWSERARNLLRAHMGRTEGTCLDFEVDLGGRETVSLKVFVPADSPASETPADTEPARDGLPEDLVPESLGVRSNHPLFDDILTGGTRASNREFIQPARRRVDSRERPRAVCALRMGDFSIPVFVVPPREVPEGVDAVAGGLLKPQEDLSARSYPCRIKSATMKTVFRVQDWLISRNRTWGTPLPLVDCIHCSSVRPVKSDSLPVLLPLHGGNGQGVCETCGAKQPLVGRVMDCFFDDAWCFFGTSPFKSPEENPFYAWKRNPASRVHFHSGYDTYVYLHVFRFIGHILFDLGYADHPEPIEFYHGHDLITAGDQKMAKRDGNAPDLDALLGQHGSDIVRLSVLANANPSKTVAWSEDRLKQARRIVHIVTELIALDTSMKGPNKNTPDSRAHGLEHEREHGNGDGHSNDHGHGRKLGALDTQIARIDGFVGEYRIGSAIDTAYTATRNLIRLSSFLDSDSLLDRRQKLLAIWRILAPETTGSV